MPLSWTSEQEKKLLLIAIIVADLKPTPMTWRFAAHALGEGVTTSAVRYEFMVLPIVHTSSSSLTDSLFLHLALTPSLPKSYTTLLETKAVF